MESEFLATTTALLAASIRMSTPLTLAGIGETFSEKAGILNIGLEGIMLSGAFFSFITAYYTQSILLGVAGAIGGGFVSSALGFGTVTGFDLRSLIIAVCGAVVLLILYRVVKK